MSLDMICVYDEDGLCIEIIIKHYPKNFKEIKNIVDYYKKCKSKYEVKEDGKIK